MADRLRLAISKKASKTKRVAVVRPKAEWGARLSSMDAASFRRKTTRLRNLMPLF